MHKQFMYEKKNKFNKPKKSMKSFNEKRKYIYGNKISEEKRWATKEKKKMMVKVIFFFFLILCRIKSVSSQCNKKKTAEDLWVWILISVM